MQKAPSQAQVEAFERDGFLLVPDFWPRQRAAAIAERFAPMFRGHFETTVPPDEWRWVEGRDPDDVTRMIWNGWKSDLEVASLALSAQVGSWCATLAGWRGARLNQDGCLWKPPGAQGLAFHQDALYNAWVAPCEVLTCWVALDPAPPDSGSIAYARGSHRWGPGTRPEDFHKPQDHLAGAKAAAHKHGKPLEIVTADLPPGGAAFHHGWLWHGSGPNNTTEPRRALALHCMPHDARFHPTAPAYAQGRYRAFGSTTMHESHYPILWSDDGRRSRFIEEYLASPTKRDYVTHAWRP